MNKSKNELDLYFEYKCRKGLKDRNLDNKPQYIERLNYEIKVITSMKYCGYFLIVQDIMNWALDNNIYVSPGRGSAAGCLASYCLKITGLDPIKWGLMFERFLNPGRMGNPYITVDEINFNKWEKNILPELTENLDIDYK